MMLPEKGSHGLLAAVDRQPQAREAIRRLDERVGRLMTALDKRRLGVDTVVALVSDHGLADVSRPISLDAALKSAGLAAICRVQSTGMGAFLMFSKESEEYIQRVRVFLEQNMETLGISHIYGVGELQAMGAGGHVHLAVEAAPEVAFVDDLALEKRAMATHGFGPDHPAAQCLFVLAGPGIRKGIVLPRADMEDIAPTLMRAIGLNMPSARGKALADCFENIEKW